jgi:uncharacterized protein YkwD
VRFARQDGIAPANATSVTLTQVEQQVFEAQNEERTSRGLVALELDERLVEIARERARQIAAAQSLSHTNSDGTTAFKLLNKARYSYGVAGENLACNDFDEADAGAEAVAGFLESPTHRGVLLNPQFRPVGLGAMIGARGVYKLRWCTRTTDMRWSHLLQLRPGRYLVQRLQVLGRNHTCTLSDCTRKRRDPDLVP